MLKGIDPLLFPDLLKTLAEMGHDEAIVLTVQELNWLLDGFDLWRNRPHQVLTPRFVA